MHRFSNSTECPGRWKAFLIISILLFSSSCEDYLDLLPPDGLVMDEFWEKKEDVEAVLMGAYQRFSQLHEKLFLFGEIRADMVEDFTAPEYQRQIIYGNIDPDNELCDWSIFYEVINYCNFVIEFAPGVAEIDNTFTEFQMKAYQGEAVFLRSLAYFYLVRIFKDVPLVLTPTVSDAIDFFPEKSADTTILRVIKEDLKSVQDFVLEDYGSLENNKGRANRAAIRTLIADIALWNFEYEECLQYIQKVEEMGEYILLKPGDYYDNFYPGNSFESIFEFQFDQSADQPSSLYALTNRSNGDYRASEAAAEILGEESGEIIRGNSAVYAINESDHIIWKYLGTQPDGQSYRGGSEFYSQNWIVYRKSEILLMKAEALSQKVNPDFGQAQDLINEIRSRALVSSISIPENSVAFEDAILLERAIEFSYEGKRWFDLLRMGRRNDYLRKDNLIRIIIEDVSSSQKLVLASKLTDPYGWYMPIYYNEIEANDNLEQNPYYDYYQPDKY